MDLQLEGRTCLVTGASSGIGRGIAYVLAAEGVRLALAGRDREALESLRDEVSQQGARDAIVCTGDISTREGAQSVARQASDAFGHVEMLVNNAGGSRPFQRTDTDIDHEDELWDEAFALNFSAARRLSDALTPSMVARKWGRVINVTGAVFAASMNAATPAKAALQSWSKSLASELAPHGVTVNCVAPGRINSRQIAEKLHPTAESREAYIKANIPAGYFGEPQDFANVVAFLLSPLSRYVTGTTIHIDGGLYRLAP
jgi:3-oxoacyl-[acyl-carrier protein] reductase